MPGSPTQSSDLTYTLLSNNYNSPSASSWTFNLQAKLPAGQQYYFYDAYNISKPNHNAIVIYMRRDGENGMALTWTSGQHIHVPMPTINDYSNTPLNHTLSRTLIILLHEPAVYSTDLAKLHNSVESIYQKITLLGPYNSYVVNMKDKNDKAGGKVDDGIFVPKKAGMTLISRAGS